MRFYRLQMKKGSKGATVAERFLNMNRITADLDYAGDGFDNLTPSDVIMVHTGAYPLALVRVKNKVLENELAEGSFGVDYNIDIIGWYSDLDEITSTQINLYGFCPPTGTFSAINQGNSTFNKIITWYNIIQQKSNMQDKIEILKHKNQIILQGPPGTGKTRLAKQIASALTTPKEIDFQNIQSLIKVGLVISSSSNRTEYKVTKVEKDSLDYFRKSTNNYGKLFFQDICKAFKDKIWLNQKISNGSDTYSAAFAKHIFENFASDKVKIVQFHPSYSYEDFVRGISVTSENGVVTYNTENRTLASFASDALKNQINSEKDQTDLAREVLIELKIKAYSEYLSGLLEDPINWTDSELQLTPSIRITNIEDSAFKFVGSEWYDRLKFDQIKKMLLLGLKSAEEIKNTPGFQKTVYHRTTYYLKVINNIRAKFPEVDEIPSQTTIKESLKNYVLIIDEINRANLPSVLGELIYALEYRDEAVSSLYSIEEDSILILPRNLYIIGTMNTSDRSVGHIDYAIRRRFAFVDVLPEILNIENFQKETFKKVAGLFIKNFDQYELNPKVVLVNSDCLNDEFRPEDVWLGHSYFISEDEDFAIRKKYEIIPILKEYVKDGILKDTDETRKIIGDLVQ